jgi:uncharacterized BrkB/YihY/UPF0761 family membrane protein
VTTTLFALVFEVLPDAEIRWGEVLVGALFTATLFARARRPEPGRARPRSRGR